MTIFSRPCQIIAIKLTGQEVVDTLTTGATSLPGIFLSLIILFIIYYIH
jgi:hypothetical protein